MLADPSSARQRLMALEERVPWKAVKKAWETRRAEWVAVVSETLDVPTLVQHLLILESMLKTDALSSQWNTHKNQWKARLSVCNSPGELEAAANEFEAAIQWSRYLVGPDGRPLTEAEIASGVGLVGGSTSRPLPPPLATAAPPVPPEGVPRSAARMLLLLQSMGVGQFEPKVAVQLLDVMHSWTTHTLLDASANSRMRVLNTGQPAHQRQQLAFQPEPPLERVDVELAVRARSEHNFTRVAAREVLAQHAADTNAEPMPILPRRPIVALPTNLSECVPSARRLIARGIELDDEEDIVRGALISHKPPPPVERPRSHRAAPPQAQIAVGGLLEPDALAGGAAPHAAAAHATGRGADGATGALAAFSGLSAGPLFGPIKREHPPEGIGGRPAKSGRH